MKTFVGFAGHDCIGVTVDWVIRIGSGNRKTNVEPQVIFTFLWIACVVKPELNSFIRYDTFEVDVLSC